jgi:hypothetical protein
MSAMTKVSPEVKKQNHWKFYFQPPHKASTPTELFAGTLLWWKDGELQTAHYAREYLKTPKTANSDSTLYLRTKPPHQQYFHRYAALVERWRAAD